MSEIQPSDLRLIELKNSKNSRLKILNFGATLFSFEIPDHKNELKQVVVGPENPEDYITPEYHSANKGFGGTIGRFAGRISKGKFEIEDEEYALNEIEEGVHLHGGEYGFHYKLWQVEEVSEGENPSVTLSYLSKDMEEGYPGNLSVRAKYTLTEDNMIKIRYSATTDKTTVVNLTNHSYFNLNGEGGVGDHFLQVNASKILELGPDNLPTGNLIKLKDNPKDYKESKLVGDRDLDDVYITDIAEDEIQAQLFSPLTGIKLRVKSNQPVLVIYSPETLPKTFKYTLDLDESYPAMAIEAQNFPDAPNFRNFPSSLLEPGETYKNNINFIFSVK
ncbi:aldose epimerase family protein [Gramella sp. AN32]|uniref:Aldose 1-epimerase n=1 Tax=Christiangramia antarctica TaxID=2058158 RepID=A0ABW5X0T2_9FLAO|nr:aldose epimerase family protein [Gramella sp. AN32]MCM4155634.1 galactose mutarotase [Gramella sp. AN32]